MVKSHGCGRRMARNGPDAALAEAIERRRRIIRAHGSLSEAQSHAFKYVEIYTDGGDRDDRRWAYPRCECTYIYPSLGQTETAEDVGLIDGVPVAMCDDCRDAQHHASPPPTASDDDSPP